MPAETDRHVECAGRVALAEDDRLAQSLLVHALQRERADGSTEAQPAELLACAHRLEQAHAVHVVGPDEDVRGEAPVRCLDHAIERAAVRP